MVRDALATCRVELWSATHWPPLFPQAHRRSCSDEGPAQRGHLLTGVGARKHAVGNTTVATPGSVSRLDTAGVQNKGAAPRTAQETGLEKLCSCLRFSAAPCVAFCVLCRWFCFPVRFCCSCLRFCAGRWVVSTVRVFPSLCFTGADPETEHFRRQPPSTYAVTEYAATYIGGNAGLPIVLYTVQFFSSFSPSSILASAYCAFHRPSRERKRYYSLWSSVFPVPSARRVITSYSRLSPNARRHNSSRQPHHIVYLAMAVAATVHDRRCGLSSRRQPCVELFVTGTHFVRVHRVMFWTSASLRPTAKTLRRHAM